MLIFEGNVSKLFQMLMGKWTLGSTKQDFAIPDSKVHGANMGPTWVLSAPDGPHVGPMSLAVKE